MKIDTTISAGATLEYFEPGDFFRILESAGPLDVRFYRQGAEVSRADNVTEGYAEKFRVGEFDRVQIGSATTQTISFVIRYGQDVFFDAPPTGNVSLGQGAFSQSQKTVTNASGELLAANSNRRYLLIQNNDASGVIYVNVASNAATTANGIKIEAGGAYECATFVPSGQINAIGSIASNANVIVVEG